MEEDVRAVKGEVDVYFVDSDLVKSLIPYFRQPSIRALVSMMFVSGVYT